MALKGKTTFELTNIETGEVSVVEDNNMLTNGLRHLLRVIPGQSSNPTYKLIGVNRTESVSGVGVGAERAAKMLTGGLLLFDTTIEENVDTIIPQAGNVLVGSGTCKAYSGANSVAGSYNSVESGIVTDENGVPNGYKHVWDFSTSQGNGHIACACLTTRDGGIDGWGFPVYDSTYGSTADNKQNREGSEELCSRDSAFFRNPSIQNASNYPNEDVLYFDYDREIAICLPSYTEILPYLDVRNIPVEDNYASWNNSIYGKKSITLDIRRLCLRSYSIQDNIHQGSRVLETITVDMPQSLSNVIDELKLTVGYWGTRTVSDDGFIYISFFKSASRSSYMDQKIPAGEKIHVWKIDAHDFSSEYFTITNTIGRDLRWGYSSTNQYYYITNKCCVVSAYDNGYMYSISLEDNSNVNPILLPSGENFINTNYDYCFSLNGRLFIASSYIIDLSMNIAYYLGRTITNMLQVYNPADDYYDGTSWHRASPVYGNSGGLIAIPFTGQAYGGGFYHSEWAFGQLTNLLLTINNLDTPVTKTTAQTMKVTYTLLESDGEEETEE